MCQGYCLEDPSFTTRLKRRGESLDQYARFSINSMENIYDFVALRSMFNIFSKGQMCFNLKWKSLRNCWEIIHHQLQVLRQEWNLYALAMPMQCSMIRVVRRSAVIAVHLHRKDVCPIPERWLISYDVVFFQMCLNFDICKIFTWDKEIKHCFQWMFCHVSHRRVSKL